MRLFVGQVLVHDLLPICVSLLLKRVLALFKLIFARIKSTDKDAHNECLGFMLRDQLLPTYCVLEPGVGYPREAEPLDYRYRYCQCGDFQS